LADFKIQISSEGRVGSISCFSLQMFTFAHLREM